VVKDLLLEIGTEEMPARLVRGAMEQLRDRLVGWMAEARIAHGAVKAYATPRRLAVFVADVAERQADRIEEVRGPSRKAAIDADGRWTQAALGFARAQGVEPAELYVRDAGNGAEYVYARKHVVGADTVSVLAEALPSLIAGMSFPRSMRWGSHSIKFIRPIRWLVALFGDAIVPFELAGVRSGRVTRGHRFLGGELVLEQPADYEDGLRRQCVLADPDRRRQEILAQIDRLASESGWRVVLPDDLIEEVLFLVEWPTALVGSFDPEFLRIPPEVLTTSMREHQRYFPVTDESGRLLPHFVTVRDGDARSLETVRRGNEKVLRARLSDAKFFYEEDLKLDIDECVRKLDSIVFHEELGSLGDKVRRVRAIARRLADMSAVDAQTAAWVDRAASICKFDLVTQMVYEFPELEGVMGGYYAKNAGEPEPVARAVAEHYRPRHAGDEPPQTAVGAIVGIADKIDTIVGCFSIGIVPTGSADPYALRRQASGIVQTMLESGISFPLSALFRTALDVHAEFGCMKRGSDEVLRDLAEFFGLRVRNVLDESGTRYDVVDAVMEAGFDDVATVVRKARAVTAALDDGAFRRFVEAYGRVANLADKASGLAGPCDPALFEHPAEQALFDCWEDVARRFGQRMEEGRESEALEALYALSEPVAVLFESVMVMAEDENIRRNRLALLRSIADGVRRFAEFRRLVKD